MQDDQFSSPPPIKNNSIYHTPVAPVGLEEIVLPTFYTPIAPLGLCCVVAIGALNGYGIRSMPTTLVCTMVRAYEAPMNRDSKQYAYYYYSSRASIRLMISSRVNGCSKFIT